MITVKLQDLATSSTTINYKFSMQCLLANVSYIDEGCDLMSVLCWVLVCSRLSLSMSQTFNDKSQDSWQLLCNHLKQTMLQNMSAEDQDGLQ